MKTQAMVVPDRAACGGGSMTEDFMTLVLYEHRTTTGPYFFVGVSLGRAEHSLAGPFQTQAAACAWNETQTTIGQGTKTISDPCPAG